MSTSGDTATAISPNTSRRSILGTPGSFMGLSGEIVTVVAGAAETPFHIHRGLLMSKSAFFDAALTGSWKEATEGKIRLIDDDPEIFSSYVLWIYNQDWKSSRNGEELCFDACCHLYVLADKLGSEALENSAIDQLCQYAARDAPGWMPKTVRYVYDTTSPGSPLRRLMADFLAWEMNLSEFKGLVDLAPACLYNALKVCVDRLLTVAGGTFPYDGKTALAQARILRESKFGLAKLVAAIGNLPRLQRIALSNFWDITQEQDDMYPESNAFKKTYGRLLADVVGDSGHYHQVGTPQMLSILRGLDQTGILIGTLSFGWVDWHLFRDEETIKVAARTLHSLKILKMRMRVGHRNANYHARLCQKGQLLAFFRLLPSLQSLNVIFDTNGDGGKAVDLRSAFGDMIWLNLRSISLDYLVSRQANLLGLLGRHAKTLRVVKLAFIYLSLGMWPKIWINICKSLDLDEFITEGDLWYKDFALGIPSDCDCFETGSSEKIRNCVLRVAGTESYTEKDLCRFHGQ
ncbi:MAG: hypothetical protein Q9213_002106 [Squamulea squamosa]